MATESLPDPRPSQPLMAAETDPLVREFRRGQKQFAASIFWRDLREVAVSLLLLPVWVGMGVGIGLPWTWYLVMPGLAWIAAFLVTDRWRQRRSPPGDSPIPAVQMALTEVEHQIWLLRNLHWWYLLPLALPIVVFVAHTSWQLSARSAGATALATAFATLIVGGVGVLIYGMNQQAVRSTLEPRRQELGALLRSLAAGPSPDPAP